MLQKRTTKTLILFMITLATILAKRKHRTKSEYHSSTIVTSYTNKNGDIHKSKLEKVNSNGKKSKYVERRHIKNGRLVGHSIKGDKLKVKKQKKKLKKKLKLKKIKFHKIPKISKFDDFDIEAHFHDLSKEIENEMKRHEDNLHRERKRWRKKWKKLKNKVIKFNKKKHRGKSYYRSESYNENYSNKNGNIKKKITKKINNNGKKKKIIKVYHKKNGKVLKNIKKVLKSNSHKHK